jgi:hypothetical protein
MIPLWCKMLSYQNPNDEGKHHSKKIKKNEKKGWDKKHMGLVIIYFNVLQIR